MKTPSVQPIRIALALAALLLAFLSWLFITSKTEESSPGADQSSVTHPVSSKKAGTAVGRSPVVAPKPAVAPPPARALEPVAAAAIQEAVPMPAANRLREQDEHRVSIYLRAPIIAVTVVILICLIGLAGVWSSLWVVPKPVAAPEFVGKSIEEARA